KALLWYPWWLLWCCLAVTVIGYPGETVTISCSYPEEFQTNTKIFYKQSSPYFFEVISTTESQKGRFSISEDRRSRVISVRISDVREDDGGVYYCGVRIGGNEVSYHLLYTEIHLQVSGEKHKLLLQIMKLCCICVRVSLCKGICVLVFFLFGYCCIPPKSERNRPLKGMTTSTLIGKHD
uniref:Ig-like domain-containing protein n=1 Tax=Astyanax mexicanus TaxID=7994 RepID=A0A3B1JUY5_ASTMX